MKFNKTVVSAAIVTALGAAAAVTSTTASAVGVLGAGNWAMQIEVTPTKATAYSGFKIGKDGAYNSSFTFNNTPSGAASQGMTDNDVLVAGTGSGVLDGLAGFVGLVVDASGNVTAPGTDFTGSNAGNSFDLTMTNRLGSINGIPGLTSLPWNQDDFAGVDASGNPISNGNTNFTVFSTGSASAFLPGGVPSSINGGLLVNAGLIDGDTIDDYTAVLVSGGQVGSAWGSFFGAGYYETWSVTFLSGTAASGFGKDAIFGTAGGDFAEFTAAVPVPAAVWLFGSGLMGLVGVARRRKA